MKPRSIDLDQLLIAANPVSPRGEVGELDQRARADLAFIVQAPPMRPELRRRSGRSSTFSWSTQPRRWLGGAAAACAVLATLLFGLVWFPIASPSDTSALVATPALLSYQPVDGAAESELTAVADRVAVLPDDTGEGRYAMVQTHGWYLWSEIAGRRVTSAVVPQEVTVWRAGDGSGRTVTRYTVPGDGESVIDQLAAAGELASLWPFRSLSSNDTELAMQLEEAHPVANGPAERLVAVADAYRESPIPPDVRAAILRYVAATPGLEIDGRVTDRLGRIGIAVSLTSDMSGLPTRYSLIFDDKSGRLLGDEQTLTESAGALRVPVPSVISYTAYAGSQFVAATGD